MTEVGILQFDVWWIHGKKIDFSYFAKPLLSKLRAAELGDQPKDSEQEIQGANYRISNANATKMFLYELVKINDSKSKD